MTARARRAGPVRCPVLRLALWAALTVSACVAAVPGAEAAAAPARAPALAQLLLTRADLPPGWKKVTAPKSQVTTRLDCVDTIAHPGKGWRHKEVVFAVGKGLPFVSEALATGPDVAATWARSRAALSNCRSATVTVNGKRDRVTISPLAFRAKATGTVATRWQFEATGVELGIDLIVFRMHRVLGVVSYTDAGTADARNAAGFAAAAISKAGGGDGTVRGVVSVATAPVRVARTSDGRVGYRQVGSGPPLVLVMGYSGSMETWDPQFVDALAHRFTVVVFDNAGIGKTSSLRAPLTIDAMAQQTSALISALHLGRPDVLGWSMGGLVAEALAVLHPGQVRRLVLCATYPGTGAVRPPQSTVDDLNAGGARATAVLFPPGQKRAATVFAVALSAYPSSPVPPKKVVSAQATAVLQAWAGKDPALERFRRISAPTLVADGASDRLVPAANARRLARGIAGAKLLLYKGAGHAFLFQDLTTFVPAVETFLAGQPLPSGG